MSGKANAVMWIGLFLIFANFWVSGQSTTFWSVMTQQLPTSGKNQAPPKPPDPRKKGPDPHGFVQ